MKKIYDLLPKYFHYNPLIRKGNNSNARIFLTSIPKQFIYVSFVVNRTLFIQRSDSNIFVNEWNRNWSNPYSFMSNKSISVQRIYRCKNNLNGTVKSKWLFVIVFLITSCPWKLIRYNSCFNMYNRTDWNGSFN